MKKLLILLFILFAGCIDRPYDESHWAEESEERTEPAEDTSEEEDVTDVEEPIEDIEDIAEPEEDIVEDTWVYDADAEDVVAQDTQEDTWTPEDTWSAPVDTKPEDTYQPPQDTWQPLEDTWTPPQDTYTPPKDTYQPPQDTNKPEDTKSQLGPGECPKNCKTWYDGCNTCQCNDGKIGGCTKLFCPTPKQPYCKKLHGT